MRKQTKLVAVLSAAALLAIGASMTSFAATGWQEENGTWVFYDKDGSQVTDEWEKSGDKWFYLDDAGEMATDQVVETNDQYYYVDENGAMVTNQWVQVPNDDYDGDDEEPINNWYYFQNNGRAIKGSDNNNVSLKTINGKKYTFDDEGKMLFGWVNTSGERETGDDAWQQADYYFGDENDGAMTIGWLQLNIQDDNASDTDNLDYDGDTAFDDEDQDRWFYFKTNGKKMTNETGKTINGRKYAFDGYGRMVAEWRLNGGEVAKQVKANIASTSAASVSQTMKNNIASSVQATNRADYSSSWRYYGEPENGARVTKGWFQVVPSEGLNKDKYDDDEDKWYYSDNNGELIAGEIKTINGKKYGFDLKGSMIDGLKFLTVKANDKNTILTVHDDDYYDTEEEFDIFANAGYDAAANAPATDWFAAGEAPFTTASATTLCYYFGDGSDGSMKTGKQNLDIDGDSFGFLFNKSGSTKGSGKNGLDDDKYYISGKLLKADKEDKYSVVQVVKDGSGKLLATSLLTTDEFLQVTGNTTGTVVGDNTVYVNVAQDDPTGSSVTGVTGTPASVNYYLVGTNGKVIDDKSKAKDGNDMIYVVNNKKITKVYEEN